MKVLVTGAAGFVGDALCRHLASAGHIVEGTFRTIPENRSWMQVHATGDLMGMDNFSPILDGVDAVVHLAARVHIMRETEANPDAIYLKANAELTERLALAATEAGVSRFVLLSSIKANGESTGDDTTHTETDAPAPENAYGRSKLAAEEKLTAIAEKSTMTSVSLRIPLVYGPGVGANFASLLNICDMPLPLPLGGATRNRRSLLYIGNLTAAIETVLTAHRVASGTYLLADGEDLSTADLVRRLRGCLNRSHFLLPIPPAIITRLAGLAGKSAAADRLFGSLRVGAEKFRHDFSWNPPFTVDQGLAATAARVRAPR
ncbi:MAG: hypothetical protein CMM26_01555 [Rhodospirillaceae bacterium]|nr:hypothetical protein [Rhodospirillaceae bacterium]